MADLHALMAFAHRLADAAAEETLPLFRATLDIENKLDAGAFDPVTRADRNAEISIRKLIEAEYPDHAILGEEFGEKSGNEFCWVLDPIDGTRSFIAGMPCWGTLIALSQNGAPVLGVMDQPYVGERFCAIRGGPAENIRAGKSTKIETRACPSLNMATVATTAPELFTTPGSAQAWSEISRTAQLVRYGGDWYKYALLAAGFIDVVIEEGLQPYDIQALIPVVEQAGGVITDWQGGPAHAGGQALACGDPNLHAGLLALLP